ncbi:MAG: sigma-70 family RNA polymerase sigma factor [Bryobacteraceae bacterium]|nr:sigma-70 family RNA polymerase sigma factor [Bryobacteraceae bacterium]
MAVRPKDPEISAETIESCRRGDRNAFRIIYESHKDSVYSIALYFFHGDAVTASDVTQQVFLKLMTDFRQFRGDSAFSTWLYRLVVNTCIDTARRLNGRTVSVEMHVLEAFAIHGTQEDDAAHSQIARSVQAAVSALPETFRLAILLRYFEELSYEEMAKVLNCSVGTVSSRLSRGHRLLAEKLSPLRAWFGGKES